MRKVVLLQSPSKLADVVPIFYAESKKKGLFDHYYVITDYTGPLPEEDDFTVVRQPKDEQFATNMLKLMESVPEDVFYFCCEDYIVDPEVDVSKVHDAFDFACETDNLGFLRLSHHKKVKLAHKDGPYAPMNPGYQYYISLQPSIWRKEYFKHCLKPGEDAWITEINGSKRARGHSSLISYGCTSPVFWYENFYKSGQYMRNSYAKYVKEHEVDMDASRKVYVVDENGNKKFVKLRKWKNKRGNK